jgi:hypothetical protein
LGVESNAFEGGSTVVYKEGVSKGKECVDGVCGWSPISSFKNKGFVFSGDKMGENGEVGGGGFSFVSAKFVDGERFFEVLSVYSQAFLGGF